MVSVRPGEHRGNEGRVGHLGLGLYIVRLVAEFHRGEARAENRQDESGVTVSVILPLAQPKP
jgi:signal transduction histidine kinase